MRSVMRDWRKESLIGLGRTLGEKKIPEGKERKNREFREASGAIEAREFDRSIRKYTRKTRAGFRYL